MNNPEIQLLNIKQEDMITDLVSDSEPSSYHKVTRRMQIVSEWNKGRLILVDMPDGYELRQQSWGGGFVKEGWCTFKHIILTEVEFNNIKTTIYNWNK